MHLFTQQFELNQPEKSLYTQSNETVCICPYNVSLGEKSKWSGNSQLSSKTFSRAGRKPIGFEREEIDHSNETLPHYQKSGLHLY